MKETVKLAFMTGTGAPLFLIFNEMFKDKKKHMVEVIRRSVRYKSVKYGHNTVRRWYYGRSL